MYSIMVRSVVQSFDEMETGEAYEGCWRVVWFGLDLFESEIVLIDWYSKKQNRTSDTSYLKHVAAVNYI